MSHVRPPPTYARIITHAYDRRCGDRTCAPVTTRPPNLKTSQQNFVLLPTKSPSQPDAGMMLSSLAGPQGRPALRSPGTAHCRGRMSPYD